MSTGIKKKRSMPTIEEICRELQKHYKLSGETISYGKYVAQGCKFTDEQLKRREAAIGGEEVEKGTIPWN